jgi:anti-sigma factor RsiW
MEDRKLSCDDAARAIVRLSDGTLDAGARATLDAHLGRCADCRAALETQRAVAAWLRSRPADRVSDQFAARLSARLDDASGWFGIADWRAWTLRLTPVAALLAAFVLLGSATADMRFTVDDWALNADDTSAWLLQSDVSPDESLDALVESIVTGEDPAGSGGAGDAGK